MQICGVEFSFVHIVWGSSLYFVYTMKNQSLNRVAYVKASGSRRSSVPREHITGLSMCTSLLYIGGSCCSSVLQDQQLQVMFCVCVCRRSFWRIDC